MFDGQLPAALLPLPLLQRRLQAANGTISVEVEPEPSSAEDRDRLLRLLWAAGLCLAERCTPAAAAPAAAWLRALAARLAAAPATLGWAAAHGATLRQVVSVLETLQAHPAAAALAAARPRLAQLLALEEAAEQLLPLDATRADAIAPALAAVGALAKAGNSGQAAALWGNVSSQAIRLAAARHALAAQAQLRGVEEAAGEAVAAGDASLLQLSYWRHIHPKVSLLGIKRHQPAFLHLCAVLAVISVPIYAFSCDPALYLQVSCHRACSSNVCGRLHE